jgi:Ser-tRNA(Ala) deacylase AlaX
LTRTNFFPSHTGGRGDKGFLHDMYVTDYTLSDNQKELKQHNELKEDEHPGVALNMLRKILTVCISVHAFHFHFIKLIIRQLNILHALRQSERIKAAQ